MRTIQKALMTGVAYMLPFIVAAGLIIAFTGMLTNWGVQTDWLTKLNGFGWTIMGLIPAIFAAYVAYGIADKPGIAPGFIGGYIASYPIVEGTAASGILGGLVAGLAAAYIVNQLKKLPMPKLLESLKPTLIIPFFSIIIVYFLMAYPVGYVCGWLNSTIINALIYYSSIPGTAIIIGALLSIMLAVDMGGPLGKIALAFVFAVWSDPSGIGFYVNAAVFPGIMVPAIACGITSLIAKNKFTDGEVNNAPGAIATGLVGITEAALPYAFRDPMRTIIPNVIGAGVGGALVMAWGISTAGVSGVIGIPMANQPILFTLAIAIGVVIAVALQLIMRKPIDKDALSQSNEEIIELNIF